MSLEKKSLISNRIANKKATVAKPEASKVASTRAALTKATALVKTKISGAVPGHTRISSSIPGKTKISVSVGHHN